MSSYPISLSKRLLQLSVVWICLVLGCSVRAQEKNDYILTEKDLIPEGVAFHRTTNTIYVGSIYKQKILEIDLDGKITNHISKDHFGDLSPLGMEVDHGRNRLWVNAALAPIVHPSKSNEWKTTVIAFDLANHELIRKYPLIKETNSFLNDLTITTKGDVYATESPNGKIYKVDRNTDRLKLYLDLVEFSFPNGITYYEPLNCIFVATSEGIIKIELSSKKVSLVEVEDGVDARVIDGLAIYDNYFIGHQSSKVSKFYFTEQVSKITRSEILDSGEEFDSSTTGEIGNGFYYFIVNSQIRSGVDRERRRIKPLDSLEEVIIRKIKL